MNFKILIGIMFFIYLLVLDANAQSGMQLIQQAGYCSGLYPPANITDTSTDVYNNGRKINECIIEQNNIYQKVIELYARYSMSVSGITEIYRVCGIKAYDPHYMNTKKLFSCVKTAIDKKTMI